MAGEGAPPYPGPYPGRRASMAGETQGWRSSLPDKRVSESVVSIQPTSLSGGGVGEKAAAVFNAYDENGRNELNHDQASG